MVPRSNDQPTDTGFTSSASRDDSWSGQGLSAGGPDTPPAVDEQAAGEHPEEPEEGGIGNPPAAPVPLWPPPPPHVMPGLEWPAPEIGAQTPGSHDTGTHDNGSVVARRVSVGGNIHVDSLGRPLASWAKRILAILVDFLLLSLLLSWFGHEVFPNLLSSSASAYNSVPQSQALSFLGISFLVWVGYLSLFGSSRRGQTLGMMLYGIAVRDLEGGPVKVGRAIIRSVILVVLSGFLIDAFWPLWDPRRQALHDKPAGTVVVDIRLAALLEQLPPGFR